MKHFYLGSNAQVVAYVQGTELMKIVSFTGKSTAVRFGDHFVGEAEALEAFAAFSESDALALANRVGDVEDYEPTEELGADTTLDVTYAELVEEHQQLLNDYRILEETHKSLQEKVFRMDYPITPDECVKSPVVETTEPAEPAQELPANPITEVKEESKKK